MSALYAAFSLTVLIYVSVVLFRRQREDSRRVREGRDEANRLIDEYETLHGPGSSGWAKFK